MALVAWPEAYFGMPTLALKNKTINPVLRSTLQKTSIIQRDVPGAEVRSISTTFNFNDEQCGAFQAWVKFKIDFGASSFTMNCKMGDGIKNFTFRIIRGRYNAQIIDDNPRWKVTCNLETFDPRIIDEDVLDEFLDPEGDMAAFLGGDPLQELVEITLPGLF